MSGGPGTSPRTSAGLRQLLVDAGARIEDEVGRSPRYAHTSHLLLDVAGDRVLDTHLGGPMVCDVFSVAKTVLASVVGCGVRDGLLPPLDDPVADVLPALIGTPSAGDTWRQLLTMTRGSTTDGPWDVDAVTALPHGLVEHIAAAPKIGAPGTAFRYDNAGTHLLSAALGAVVGRPVASYAREVLFEPLGIREPRWLADPDGITFGFGHLFLSAHDLARLGNLWLEAGAHAGEALIDPGYFTAMTTAHTTGGPPEHEPYGYLTWVGDHTLMAGGWAGQHVMVMPSADAVLVTTGDPGFEVGPPPSDRLPPDWAPALELVRRHLMPLLRTDSVADRP